MKSLNDAPFFRVFDALAWFRVREKALAADQMDPEKIQTS